MDHSHHMAAMAEMSPAGLDLLGAFLVGLVGSVHCVGMCGPLVALHARAGSGVAGISLYQAGRILSYTLVGFLLGSSGAAMPPILAGTAAAVVGGMVVIVGLGLAGIASGSEALSARLAVPVAHLSRTVSSWARERGSVGSVAMGAVHALFPCPLLVVAWGSALALAHPIESTAMMFAFGLGTVPALAVTAATASRLPLGRAVVQRFAGAGIALWGLVLVSMGVGQVLPG